MEPKPGYTLAAHGTQERFIAAALDRDLFHGPNPIGAGGRPARSAARYGISGKRRDAHVGSPTFPNGSGGGRDKFTTPKCGLGGANRSCPVVNFSPVKRVTIKDRIY